MKLSERLAVEKNRDKEAPVEMNPAGQPTGPTRPLVIADANRAVLRKLKNRLHALAIDTLDLKFNDTDDNRSIRQQFRKPLDELLDKDPQVQTLPVVERQWLFQALMDELFGLGPLEGLLGDPGISDIMINSAKQVFIEKGGQLTQADIEFDSNQHLLSIIQRIVAKVGRRVDESSPMVDARLPDGSRVNAVVAPIALDGPAVSIRRFGRNIMGPQDLVKRGVATADMMRFLAAAVQSKCNLLVSGGTGAGKTTLLNVLSGLIPHHERVITIEDSAELALQGHHVVRMEARPANIEGKGEVSIRQCVKNALRMRPDRIVIGEIRSAEVLDMLQAMNTGHEGSMATIHANTPSGAVDRLMMLLALAGSGLTNASMLQFVGASVHVIVQVARFADGRRRITGIAELASYDELRVDVRDVYSYSPTEDRFIFSGHTQLLQRFADHHIQWQPTEVAR